jgi:anaerobic selenocysteine-containing dehydrogenase
VNTVTGNLDREGGVMFTQPAFDPLHGPKALRVSPGGLGRWKSRVRGLPEFMSELPVAALAEEILTEGPGRIEGLLTVAGNPVLSTPNGGQLDRALARLPFMVSIDPSLNETTRHAHVILPPTTPLERGHYDLAFHVLAVRTRRSTRRRSSRSPRRAPRLGNPARAAASGGGAPQRPHGGGGNPISISQAARAEGFWIRPALRAYGRGSSVARG